MTARKITECPYSSTGWAYENSYLPGLCSCEEAPEPDFDGVGCA